MSSPPIRIVMLGGSSGGVRAATEALAALEPEVPAAVFVVLHFHDGTSPSLKASFAKTCRLPANFATHGETISPGRIYISPPDHHLRIIADAIQLSRGPRINLQRPAIDTAFRSAAASYGPSVIGIILSGMLDDGVAGLEAVKACGGTAIVQDPADALYPELPEHVLTYNKIDHISPASRMGALLSELVQTPARPWKGLPLAIKLENDLDMQVGDELPSLEKLGQQASMACPECQGPLWEINKSMPPRYRCHIGHAYTLRCLKKCQDQHLELILLNAYRSMEEKAKTQERLAECSMANGQHRMEQAYRRQAKDSKNQAHRLREMLVGRP